MIRRPPRSTQSRSSAASDVYKRQIISIDHIQSLAERTGAAITEKYGHLLLEVKGIRHTRQARSIEKNLLAMSGVLEASVSASGMVRLEFDKKETNFDEISKKIEKEDLQIQWSSLNKNDHTEVSKNCLLYTSDAA